jgi:hypothetical protein
MTLKKAVHHSHAVIVNCKKLIDMKLLTVVNAAKFYLEADILPTDPAKRINFLKNLWIYASIGLGLDPEHILEVHEADTGLPIATIANGNVTMEETFIL